MDLLPTEVLLQIIGFLHDPKDKIELLRTNRCIHSILAHTPICWSPLDLSLYTEKINNAALLSILRSRSLEIVVPKQPLLQQPATLLTTPTPPHPSALETTVASNRSKAAQLDSINISGCHLLTSEAILMLVNTLPYLKTLDIDRYTATSVPEPLARHPRHYRRTRSKMIDMLRDDLYQCRPRHGLSSSTMDLSKQPLTSLTITDTTLQRLLVSTPFLTDLSLQHQRLSMAVCRSMHKRLPQLRHLDISSCEVMSPDLQYLVRTMAGSLLSLKMLNLALSNLTLLCLQLHGGDSLECLHLSCLDPLSLPGLARTVKSLTKLTDFRLTRLPSGNVDELVCTLATHHPLLQSLDLSPKLELYPKFTSASHPKTYPAISNISNNNSRITSAFGPPSSAIGTPSSTFRTTTAAQPSTARPFHDHDYHRPESFGVPRSSSSMKHQQQIRPHQRLPGPRHTQVKAAARLLPPQPASITKRLGGHITSSSSSTTAQTSSSSSSIPATSSSSSSSNYVTFTRSERDLYLTDVSMDRLTTCFNYLTVLRLCFPIIDGRTLSHFFQHTTCPLRTFELRLRNTNTNTNSTTTTTTCSSTLPSVVNYLEGLEHLTQLHTLLLYSVPINEHAVDSILATTNLQSMTIHDAKQLGKIYPFFLRRWLLELPRLGLLRMDWVTFAWTSVADIVCHRQQNDIEDDDDGTWIQQECFYRPNDPLYDGDSMFIKTSSEIWEWVE
ncbi:hypothetical protein BCR42DRAFT_416112 [Absidia repens]|uniref:F-box domain-containing protein n=1 Tax=Absidia repens TaxID=90262 RepID=A0A1X2IG41_9FUNG|nr:hypothetical protein BCR42DRAFT_416112 [Absidia repens]